MFIYISDRRVNVLSIQEYKATTKQKYYFVKIKYISGQEEDVSFITDKERRDKFLDLLDSLTKPVTYE